MSVSQASATAAAVPPPARPGQTRLGWIGAGVMGRSMAGRLLDAGFAVTVFTRRRETAAGLLSRGAVWADSPAAVANESDVEFTMVGHPADVRDVVLGTAGVLAGLARGSVLVDHTTSSPELAVEIDARVRERGGCALDAPVSGGDRGAREGTLTVMVGGSEAVGASLTACWQAVAGKIVACGGPGAGQRTKLANQIVIASGMIGICEALVYSVRAGLDPETTLEAISSGAAGSWSLSNLAPRMLAGDFAPGFMVEHFVKDLRLALDECRRLAIDLPGLALAESLYARLLEQGNGRLGTQALVLALAAQARCHWPAAQPPQSP
ncbi:MAG: NAD(P)-dependent oxidoreductase [Planctomycetia bacterium]